MSDFVDDCRKEWNRLGVPRSEANEMAADLEADLAEARAEGVSPEEVLGNGFFDPKAFAASWAMARGVISSSVRMPKTISLRSLALGVGTLLCVAASAVGFLILAGARLGSATVAGAAIGRSIRRPIPGIFANPHRIFIVRGSGDALDPLGWVLLVVGLVGVGVALWFWKPWSTHRRTAGAEHNVGMPSYL